MGDFYTTNVIADGYFSGQTLNIDRATITNLVVTNIMSGLTIAGNLTVTSAITTNTFKITNNPIAGYVLTSNATGNAVWQSLPTPNSGETKLDLQSVTATATTTSSSGSATWINVGSMTLTTKNLGSSATTYTIEFNGSGTLSNNSGNGNIRLVLNGNYIPFSQRNFTNGGSAIANTFRTMSTIASVNGVKNGDIIKVQVNSPTGQIGITYRTLSIMGVLNLNLV